MNSVSISDGSRSLVVLLRKDCGVAGHDILRFEEEESPDLVPAPVSPHHDAYLCLDRDEVPAW